MIVTPTQQKVLENLTHEQTLMKPRRTLQALEKKGLVAGSKRVGWSLTVRGSAWLACHKH